MKIFDPIIKGIRARAAQYILLLCAAVLITVAAIVLKTPFYRVLPLYVSLFVMLYPDANSAPPP